MLKNKYRRCFIMIILFAGCFTISCVGWVPLNVLEPDLNHEFKLVEAFVNSDLNSSGWGTSCLLKFKIANNSKWTFRECCFSVSILDKDGKEIWKEDSIILRNFISGEIREWDNWTGVNDHINVPYNLRNSYKSFKLVFKPEKSFAVIEYLLDMEEPVKDVENHFIDKIIDIKFLFSHNEVLFELKNQSDIPIKLDWDKVAFIDIEGNSHRVIHKGVRLIDRNSPQVVTTIPPKAKISDFWVPSDNIYYSETISEWCYLPINKDISFLDKESYVGKSLSIFFPLLIGHDETNYSFKFKITSYKP